MSKRFTDTEIWDEDWFLDLPNKYKLFWQYIKDRCDDVGVWRPNKSMAQRIIGEPINMNEFLTFVNVDGAERIVVLDNGRWFLRGYFIFQYGIHFSPTSPVHRGALKRLLVHGLHLRDIPKLDCKNLKDADNETLKQIAYQKPNDSLLIGYGYPINSLKDKDKDKDKNKSTIVPEIPIVQKAAAAAKKEEENLEEKKNLNGIPVLGMEKVAAIANAAWKDEAWKKQVCKNREITMLQLQKWLGMFNTSAANDRIADFTVERYRKMSEGWIEKKQSKGMTVEILQKQSEAPPLTRLSHGN